MSPRARVHANAVVEHEGLLPGAAANVGGALAVCGLLHIHPRLVTKRVGGRTGESLVQLFTVDP